MISKGDAGVMQEEDVEMPTLYTIGYWGGRMFCS